MIKIFGGVARGFSLKAPSSSQTRPTSVLLRRKFFDSHQDLTGMVFIDICAGTGSVGLEAASRGAEKVYFIEKSKLAMKTLRDNVKAVENTFSLDCALSIEMSDYLSWLRKYFSQYDSRVETIIFFDPPYENLKMYEEFLKILRESSFKGKYIIEACQQKTLPLDKFQEQFGAGSKVYKQGSSYFVIYDSK